MSRSLTDDQQERMKEIANQVIGGTEASKLRKQRNKGLIHIGIAVLQVIENEKGISENEKMMRKIEKHTIQSELRNVQNLLRDAHEKSLF